MDFFSRPIDDWGGDNYYTDNTSTFVSFVLSSQPYTQSQFEAINNELSNNPTAAGELLQSERYRAFFLSDFAEILGRIQAWLESLTNISTRPRNKLILTEIVHGFANTLVVPLLDPEYSEYQSSPQFLSFLILSTRLAYEYRHRGYLSEGPKTYRVILELIASSESQHLMRSTLPSDDGADLFKRILAQAQAGAEIQAIGSLSTFEGWLTVAADLCSSCLVDHDLQAELERWKSLVELRDSLTNVLATENERRSNSSRMRAFSIRELDFTKMRKLSADDKKSGRSTASKTTTEAPPSLSATYLSKRDLENLKLFNMPVPTGIGSLESLLSSLRGQMSLGLFRNLMKHFPCPRCQRHDQFTSQPQQRDKYASSIGRSVSSLPNSFTGTLFGPRLGPWRISISEKAFKDMLSFNNKGDPGILRTIATKLRELASGNWALNLLRMPLSKKMREECGSMKERIPLWRAAYGSGGRILWQVNTNYDEECDMDTQMITVWRIGTSEEVQHSVREILQIQSAYTESHIQRCSISRPNFEVLQLPEQWYHTGEVSYPELSGVSETEERDGEMLETSLSNRFYALTEKVLDRILEAPDMIEFPFEISREETEIVKHANSAAFILGRSGTGKTTCLLFKLLSRNIASRQNGGTIRQILLTRSSYLAEILRTYLERLMQSQLGKPASTAVTPKPKQQGFQDYALKESRDPLEDHTLNTLHDGNFPLVCTFDQLFCFLEKVIELTDPTSAGLHRYGALQPSKLINYKVFSDSYWKKHHQDHRKGLEPDLVFAEILGIIKGSTNIGRDFKPLSRDEYVAMSTRKAPVFTDDEARHAVYSIYENYESQKGRLGHKDDIDRAVKLLRYLALEKNKELKRTVQSLFDEVYVDEVQDNKLLEIDLLLTLVRNPRGIQFAGDTAQCISRDNTFRFQDIKARFYEFFYEMAQKSRKPDWAKAELFSLAKNYRSHQGILSLAGSIIEMLCNGFPGQIDLLPPELGNYPGTKPTIFMGFDHRILTHANAGAEASKAVGYFGAEQVIIVKNDAAKDQLAEMLGSTLILSIYKSKGLEFDDVVLYNFFSDSIWDNVQLPILKLLLTKDAETRFNRGRYAGLSSELKQLYVAVTRARKNLWIVETNKSSVQNLVTLWTWGVDNGDPLVSLVDIDETGAETKARKIIKPTKYTDLEAWRKQGEMLFQRGLYEDARFCFRNAKHKQGEDLAEAYLLCEKASEFESEESISSEQLVKAKRLYSTAATLFEDSGFIQKAAETWGAAGEYINAAEVLRKHEEYGKAALYYAKAGDFRQAAECHTLANQHDEAVHALRKGEHFEELLEYLRRHRENISKAVTKRYSTLINILLQRGDLSETLLPAALDTLGNENAIEEFYIKYKRTDDLLEFYKKHNRHLDFFKLAISEGRFEDAACAVAVNKGIDADDYGLLPEDLFTLVDGLCAGNTWQNAKMELKKQSGRQTLNATASNHAGTLWPEMDVVTPKLRGHRSGWEEISWCIRNSGSEWRIRRQRPDNVYAGFFKDLGNEFLDLLEFLRLDPLAAHCMNISKVDDISQLPVTTMHKFASIAGDLLSRKIPRAAPNLLTNIGGLKFSYLEDQVVILRWSPLFPVATEKDSPHTDDKFIILNRPQAYNALTDWLVPIVARVLPMTLAHLRSLLLPKRHNPCFRALQGDCNYPPEQCRRGRHTRLTPEELRKNTTSLLDAAELSCASDRLYYNRKLSESDSKDYLGTRRAFLERLLKELTFFSPLLSDSELQKEIWKAIVTNQYNREWPHVKDGLATLFFYRLRPVEWARRGTASALLEERSFASRLGVIPRFAQFLSQKVFYCRHEGERQERQWKLNFIRDCHTDIANLDLQNLFGCISSIMSCISNQPTNALLSFHAVLSLYERMSLELLNRLFRGDLLVPRSRKEFIRHLTPYLPTSDEKARLQWFLINLLISLCNHLKQFAIDNNTTFLAGGEPLWQGDRHMIRRGLDHLTVCVVNLGVPTGHNHSLPIGYPDLCARILEIIQLWAPTFKDSPTLIAWRSQIPADQLAQQLANIYRNYNKDELVIIGPMREGRSRFDFLTGTPPITRVIPGQVDPPSNSPAIPSSGKEFDVGEEAIAASKISACWKRCSKRLQAKKEHLKKQAILSSSGPEGQAQVIINDVTASIMPYRAPRQRNILHNSGVELLAGTLTLKGSIKAKYDEAMSILTSTGGEYHVSSTAIELIQDILSHLEKRKRTLEKFDAMFREKSSVQGLLELPFETLEQKIQKALGMLGKYQKEAKEWADEIEELVSGNSE